MPSVSATLLDKLMIKRVRLTGGEPATLTIIVVLSIEFIVGQPLVPLLVRFRALFMVIFSLYVALSVTITVCPVVALSIASCIVAKQYPVSLTQTCEPT